MSKTYTFNATVVKGGTGAWTSDWNDFTVQGSNQLRIGKVGSQYLAVYCTFGTATDGVTTFASLQNKTITSATLTIPIASVGNGVPEAGSDVLPVRAKKTTASGGSGSSTAWQWTGSNLGYLCKPVTDNKVNISLSAIPANGFVIGPAASTCPTFIEAGSAVVLTVITNEYNTYTLDYDANGGSGAPTAHTFISGSSVTLSSGKPTRAGHTFLGWSQNQAATTASYAAGGTYTFNNNVTLYAVWERQTYTISFDANAQGEKSFFIDTPDLPLPQAL